VSLGIQFNSYLGYNNISDVFFSSLLTDFFHHYSQYCEEPHFQREGIFGNKKASPFKREKERTRKELVQVSLSLLWYI